MIALPAIPSSADMGGPPEPYATPETIECDPAPKPGVEAFRDWVMSTFGGESFGIGRDCDIGKPSDHHEGRAWDWKVDASSPDDQARVHAFFDWLFAADPDGNIDAMFRRTGLSYLIWDRMSWYAWRRDWQPYTRENPHTDHVHFSFGTPGAMGETSFYRWLGMEPKPVPLPGPPPSEPVERPSLTVGGLAFLASAIAAYYVAEHVPKMLRPKPRAG
jgi:hypothetical protein